MNRKLLNELTSIAIKLAKKKLNEDITPAQSDLDNIEILASDVKKIRSLLATMYKDVLTDKKENENPSVYMDAYMKLILAMLPITGAMMSADILGGALKQGKITIGAGSELSLKSSISKPTKVPPPMPPLPPKITIPKKLPPLPPIPGKKGPPPPPIPGKKGPPPPPKKL